MQHILADRRFAAFATALVCFGVVLFAPGIFADGDTYWHIAAGRWMLDNHAVLRIDPFSYTFAGQAWQTHEWLSEIAMALAYVGLSWTGVALLFAAVFALTTGLLAWHLSRILGGITLVVAIVLSVSIVSAGLLARPHLLALLPLVIWVAGLVCARAENRAPHWRLLPAMTLWANLHGGFLFGVALIGPFALEVLVESGVHSKIFRQWLLFAALAVLAATITPFGFETLLFPFKLMAMPELYGIVEWMPPKLSGWQPLPISVGATLFVCLWRGVKVSPLRLCVVLGLLYLSLLQARHQLLLAFVAPFLLAEPLAAALKNEPKRGAVSWRMPLAFALLLLAMIAGRLVWPIQKIETAMTPAAAMAHVSPTLLRTPVLNDYGFGGYLIFHDVKPFIDGRAELYGQDFLKLYGQILDGNDKVLHDTLAKYRIGWSILSADNRALPAMGRLKGWHRAYADKTAVVYVKDGL